MKKQLLLLTIFASLAFNSYAQCPIPGPDVNQPTSQIICNNGASTAVNFTGTFNSTVFSWSNNVTSIGLAASGTGNIPSFTATNPTNAPVTATITVTPKAETITFNYSGSIVNWTVPAGVTSITITAKGAEGGQDTYYNSLAGKGASMTGTFAVTPGQQLKILVGQHPSASCNNGGGGTFVTNTSNTPLIVAGGGGGSSYGLDSPSKHGQVGTSGGNSGNSSCQGVGGTSGNGGGSSGCGSNYVGGGGGLLSNGSNGTYPNSGGSSFLNGGAGGSLLYQAGFGGGGAGSGASAGGGGGGYSGGGAGWFFGAQEAVGGGGGSYNAGSAQTNIGGINPGNGVVTISYPALFLCTGIPKTFTITVNPDLTPAITGNLTFCAGGSTTLNAGVFASYNWSTGATTQTISVNTANTFTVTVTNVNGCTGTASVTTSAFVAPVITGNLTPCIGSSTTLSTGVYNSYLWSTGATTQAVTVTANAVYKVTVTNAGGCTGSASAKVVKKARPTFTLNTVDTNLCPPVTSVVLSLIGNAASYAWSPATGLNQTTGTSVIATPLVTTSYYVTATGSNGCTLSSYANVNIKPKPLLLTTTAITANSATLNWKIVDCATGYTVQYRLAGGTWLNVQVNTNIGIKVLNGLLASSSYQWRIKSKYPNGTTSKYTNPVSFTTPALRMGETLTVNALQVYPNPATDKLNLEFPFTEGDASINIVNALGQTVLTQKVTDSEGLLELNIQNLTEGLYFVTVKNGDNTFNSRFVKR